MARLSHHQEGGGHQWRRKPLYTIEEQASAMLRLAYQQFPFQEPPYDRFIRNIHLFRMSQRDELSTEKFNINEKFEQSTSLTVRKHIAIGLMITQRTFTDPLSNPVFRLSDLVDQKSLARLSYEDLENFTKVMSGSYDVIKRGHPKVRISQDQYKFYQFNSLAWKPIVELGQDEYIVPVSSLLQDAISSGLYYFMLDKFGRDFTSTFGRVFEQDVGELLSYHYPTNSVIRERKYKINRQTFDSIDWKIIEGESAVLFECKGRPLQLAARTEATTEAMTKDLKEVVVKGLTSLRREMDLASARIAELAPLHDKDLFPVIVTYEPYYFSKDITVASYSGLRQA